LILKIRDSDLQRINQFTVFEGSLYSIARIKKEFTTEEGEIFVITFLDENKNKTIKRVPVIKFKNMIFHDNIESAKRFIEKVKQRAK